MDIRLRPVYKTDKIENFEQLQQALPSLDDDNWSENWLVVGTGGIHGSYEDLPEVELGQKISVLVIRPRNVYMLYGFIVIESEEQKVWLSQAVNKTVDAITLSQIDNINYVEEN